AIADPLTLRIVGRPYDPAYFAMLRDRAKDKPIVFETDVDDTGLVGRYRSCLASVLPSVVSRTTSLPELVEDGRTGFIVPPGDAAALRSRLLQLRADPDRATTMGAAARAAVLERFTWDATAR